jgi:ABC-type Zn uptake system ZnuABC Zn-binding protein ZnuA
VTDHTAYTYFAAHYGFEQIGAVIPGYSTLAQPSAQDLAQLQDLIRSHGVKAIFVGQAMNPTLAERIAEDTGAKLVFLYSGSLTEPDGEAPTYIAYMRHNVQAIVDALK